MILHTQYDSYILKLPEYACRLEKKIIIFFNYFGKTQHITVFVYHSFCFFEYYNIIKNYKALVIDLRTVDRNICILCMKGLAQISLTGTAYKNNRICLYSMRVKY